MQTLILSSVAAILMCCRHLAVLTSHIEVGIHVGSCHSRRGPITMAVRLERWSSGACGTCFWPLQTDAFNSSVNSASPNAAPPSIPLTDWSSQKRDGIFFSSSRVWIRIWGTPRSFIQLLRQLSPPTGQAKWVVQSLACGCSIGGAALGQRERSAAFGRSWHPILIIRVFIEDRDLVH